jgi:hypothetical protein
VALQTPAGRPWSCHQRLCVEAALPDRQDVVARAENLLRAELHPERVDQRQRPEIGLRRSLEKQFVAKYLRCFLRGSILDKREIA